MAGAIPRHFLDRLLRLLSMRLSLALALALLFTSLLTLNTLQVSIGVNAQSKVAPSTPKQTLRVGIIGGGISGAATAHFLRQELDSYCSLELSVFERSSLLGGRLADVTIRGHHFEAGGSIIHHSNRYMRHFATLLNLTRVSPPPRFGHSIGIWDGGEYKLRLSGRWYGIFDTIRMLWRYGLDLTRLSAAVHNAGDKFVQVYKLQDAGSSYDSPQQLLQAVGLFTLTQQDLRHWMQKVAGVYNEALMNELVVAVTRVNYGQGLDLNALAGAVGLLPMFDDEGLWAVKEGNARVIEGLFKHAKANVYLNHTVKTIERVFGKQSSTAADRDSGIRRVSGVKHGTDGVRSNFSQEVDVIIVATPLEAPFDPIDFRIQKQSPASSHEHDHVHNHDDAAAAAADTNDSTRHPQPHHDASLSAPNQFHTTHATFLVGRLRGERLSSVSGEKEPSMILTTENATLPFTSINAYVQLDEQVELADAARNPPRLRRWPKKRIYKIFSRHGFNDTLIAAYFYSVDPSSIRRFAWSAYPRYAPPEAFLPSFELYPQSHIWYPLALERMASCMEVQSVAARNVAINIANRIKQEMMNAPFNSPPSASEHVRTEL